jgi:hypothetical protein
LDFEKLWDHIPREYLSQSLMDKIKTVLSENIRAVLIEYPYVDKDYRSTFYAFYSKRHRSYDQFCFRIHLFDRSPDMENLLIYRDAYMGSMVLRPTEIAPLGRTLIAPEAIGHFSGFVCEATFQNNIMGLPFSVQTFPHTMQDSDVTVCAHAVCWMITRYYSEKYTVYPERLTYDIAEAVQDVSFGRNIPSHGLTLGQVSQILASIGFFPEIFVKELYGKNPGFFYDILYSYIESGIPVVAAMRKKEHAIALVGHGKTLPALNLVTDAIAGRFLHTRHLIDSLIAHDDNQLPFISLHASGGTYCIDDIDAFVVPLYEKMYLNAENVLQFYPYLVESPLLQIPEPFLVARIYMTSSRSYKREIHTYSRMPGDMRKAQLELPMPKFIWLVELSTPDHYDNNLVDYRFIVDSTANQYESRSFLFIHDKHKMIINDRALTGKTYDCNFDEILLPFEIYTNNLKWRSA